MTAMTETTRDAWNEIATGYDRYVTPTHFWLSDYALRSAGLAPGVRFLDVAAGSGALTIPAARIGADVLAVDLSSVMLERLAARAKDEGLAERVECRVMDGHALDLDDDSFDVAGSQFGVMLFPDMPRGLSELARVARPGGRVLLVALGPPEQVGFFATFMAALQAADPGFTPPTEPLLPFQLGDPAKLRREMERAGLEDVRIETLDEKLEFRSGDEMWNWLINSNPVAGAVIADLNASGEQERLVRQALDGLIRERRDERGVATLRNEVHIGVGTK